MVNAMDKVPGRYREQVHEDLTEIWSSTIWQQAQKRLEEMAEIWSGLFPDFNDFISEEGWDTLTVYRFCPKEHRRKLRICNIVESVNQGF